MSRALAAAGAVALFVSLFLPWYEPRSLYQLTDETDLSRSFDVVEGAATDAWTLFTFTDIVLATIALAGLVLVFRRPTVAAGLGVAAVGVVVARSIVGPVTVFTLDLGAGVALAGAAALSIGAWLTVAPGRLEPVTGLAAFVLTASLWMSWYRMGGPDDGESGIHILVGGDDVGTASAWAVFTVADIALVVLVALTVARARWVAVAAGAVAAAVIVSRLLAVPDGFEPATGAFVALGAALVIAAASLKTRRPAPAA